MNQSSVVTIEPTVNREKVLRVAAYCRVSSDSQDQLYSFAAQVQYYTKLINENELMDFVDIYADEGLTGTKTSKRDDFNRLISDCKKGKIDRVLTKSMSRFARNTADALMYVRILKNCGISILFEKENIDTAYMSSELLLAISGAQAQEESISISKNMRWSAEKRMQNGTFIASNPPYGYRLKDGEFEIEDDEAEVVRLIFKCFLSGMGKYKIVKMLNDRNIPKKPDCNEWRIKTIDYIFRNERYIGDARLKKKYKTETLPFKTIVNHGEKPQYYVENMKNRRFPYGYEMQNGKIQICKAESNILAEIFNSYINSNNLKEIADSLKGKKVEYLPDECGWNKSRIKRIIEDIWYLGDERYPQLIQEEIFNKANSIKQIRRTTMNYVVTAENKPVVYLTRCAECGAPLYHITDTRYAESERWCCKTDKCKFNIKLTIAELQKHITDLLNEVIANRESIQYADYDISLEASIEIMRIENEIDRLLEQSDFDKDKLQNLILECASKKYYIDRVLIICDKAYTEKANSRSGGVGDETVIISPEIYNQVRQEKFIPIIFEVDDEGKAYCPTYIKSRIYIDLSTEDDGYEIEYEKLLSNIYEKPIYRKPALGVQPEWLENDTVDLSQIRDLIKQVRGYTGNNADKADFLLQKAADQFLIAAQQYTLPENKPVKEGLIIVIDQYKIYRDLFIADYFFMKLLHPYLKSFITDFMMQAEKEVIMIWI